MNYMELLLTQRLERGHKRMKEIVETVCTAVITLCICAMTFNILHENVIKGKEKKKMLQSINLTEHGKRKDDEA